MSPIDVAYMLMVLASDKYSEIQNQSKMAKTYGQPIINIKSFCDLFWFSVIKYWHEGDFTVRCSQFYDFLLTVFAYIKNFKLQSYAS